MLFHRVGSQEIADEKAKKLESLGYEATVKFEDAGFSVHARKRPERWFQTMDKKKNRLGKEYGVEENRTDLGRKKNIFFMAKKNG